MWRNKRVGVLLGGPSSEREISLKTGGAIVAALREKGYEVVELDLDENTATRLREEKIDVVFNALHGKWGEDGCVQGMLEVLRVPYTGSGVTGSAVGMDKVVSKSLFAALGLDTPDYQVVTAENLEESAAAGSPFGYPVVTKPAAEGSSVGISIVTEAGQWRPALELALANDERCLVERYVAGRELSVAVLGVEPLGIVEVRPKQMEGEAISFYDYKHKYTKGMTEYFTKPEGIDKDVVQRSEQIAVAACRAILAEGICRVDLILDEDKNLWLLEVNTIPGMTELSLVPMIARDWRGIDFADLVEKTLNTARCKVGA